MIESLAMRCVLLEENVKQLLKKFRHCDDYTENIDVIMDDIESIDLEIIALRKKIFKLMLERNTQRIVFDGIEVRIDKNDVLKIRRKLS